MKHVIAASSLAIDVVEAVKKEQRAYRVAKDGGDPQAINDAIVRTEQASDALALVTEQSEVLRLEDILPVLQHVADYNRWSSKCPEAKLWRELPDGWKGLMDAKG